MKRESEWSREQAGGDSRVFIGRRGWLAGFLSEKRLYIVDAGEQEDRTIDYVFRLLDIPWWYYLVSLVIGLVVWRVWKRPVLGLLAGYAFLILAETVLIRKPFSGEHFQPELLWSWRVWETQRTQILTNVVMFIPVGVMCGWLWKWKGLWFAVGLSILVEVLQLVSGRGLCEFDDVVHNVVGAVVGVSAAMLVRLMIKEGCGRNHGTD